MKTILAIDPGVSGGLAWRNALELKAVAMPDGDAALCELLSEIVSGNEVECWIEEIPTFAGAKIPGHCIAVLYGNFRFIEGWLTARHVRTRRVKPQAWQKPLSLGTRAGAGGASPWKRKLRDEAARRFPELDVTLKTADALLILEHAEGNQ
jgi:hypothetical protein